MTRPPSSLSLRMQMSARIETGAVRCATRLIRDVNGLCRRRFYMYIGKTAAESARPVDITRISETQLRLARGERVRSLGLIIEGGRPFC